MWWVGVCKQPQNPSNWYENCDYRYHGSGSPSRHQLARTICNCIIGYTCPPSHLLRILRDSNSSQAICACTSCICFHWQSWHLTEVFKRSEIYSRCIGSCRFELSMIRSPLGIMRSLSITRYNISRETHLYYESGFLVHSLIPSDDYYKLVFLLFSGCRWCAVYRWGV